jgi:nitroreductase
MNHRNPVERDIQPLFRQRWSPYVFDPERTVSQADLESLFEAARWTMSSFNAQPWRYIVGVRGRSQATWDDVFECLLEGNRGWAQHAPVLALGLAQNHFEHNGKPNRSALHDLGAASAALTFEATARGLVVHQMAGFDRHKVPELFGLDHSLAPFTALAIGYPGDPGRAEAEFAERDQRKRERKPLDELIIRGGF